MGPVVTVRRVQPAVWSKGHCDYTPLDAISLMCLVDQHSRGLHWGITGSAESDCWFALWFYRQGNGGEGESWLMCSKDNTKIWTQVFVELMARTKQKDCRVNREIYCRQSKWITEINVKSVHSVLNFWYFRSLINIHKGYSKPFSCHHFVSQSSSLFSCFHDNELNLTVKVALAVRLK